MSNELKKCPNCGHEIGKGDLFCQHCGNKLDFDNVPKDEINFSAISKEALPEEKKGKNKIYMIATGIIALIAIVFLFTFSKGVNLDEYVRCDIEGYNKTAKCFVHVNAESLYEDYLMRKNIEEISVYEMLEDVDVLEDGLIITIEPNENLKNGDKVKVTIKPDKNIKKKLGIKIKEYKKTIEVENLQEAQVLDVSEFIKENLRGFSPAVIFDDIDCGSYTISSDKKDKISNGDVLKMTIEGEAPDGYVFEKTTFDYKVKDMPKLVVSEQDISTDEIEQLKTSAEKYINNPNTYSGFFFSPDVYIESTKDTDDPARYYMLDDIVNSNIEFSGAKVYVNPNDSTSVTFLYFTCDCTPNKESETYKVNGIVSFNNVCHEKDGSFKYEIRKLSDLCVDKDDVDKSIDNLFSMGNLDEYVTYDYNF